MLLEKLWISRYIGIKYKYNMSFRIKGIFKEIINALLYKVTGKYNLNRVMLSIPHDAIVLDVGSGYKPSIRADVLLEKYILETKHRCGRKAFIDTDRPMILSDINYLPFLDNSFDYIICRHGIEHLEDPIKGARELYRVSKRGYIEFPSILNELVYGGYPEQKQKFFAKNINCLFHGYGVERHKYFIITDGNSLFLHAKT